MVDSEQQPFSPAQQQEEKRNILPMAIGGVIVLVLIVGVVLLRAQASLQTILAIRIW